MRHHSRINKDVDWEVVGVFDPAGDKPDFSYTVGLHDRGLPELHLWAQPSDGLDPGQDWALSARDRAGLLERAARQSCDKGLAPGESWMEEMDFGLTRVTFTVGDPVPPSSVDAYGVAAGATVLPLRFALDRPRHAERAEPDAVGVQVIREWTRQILAAAGANPVEHTDDVLAAVRTAVGAAPPRLISELVYGCLVLDQGTPMGPRRVVAGAIAHCRAAGRDAAVAFARQVAVTDTERLMGEPAVDAQLMSMMGAGPADASMRRGIRSLLRDALDAAYSCSVAVDILPRPLIAAGLAPVLTAVAPIPLLHLQETAEIRERLGQLDPGTLSRLACAEFDTDAVGAVLAAALLAGADVPPWDEVLMGTTTWHAARSLGPQWSKSVTRTLTDLARAVAYPDAAGAGRLLCMLPGHPGALG